MARWISIPEREDGSDHSRLLRGKVVGTINLLDARAITRANTPAFVITDIGMLYRQDIRHRQTAYDTFEAEIPYGPRENATGNWTWDFDTTGGTVHITNSKETVRKYGLSGVAQDDIPDHGGAIDVQGDEVRGIDIVIPAMRFSVQYKHPEGEVTLAHACALRDITGTVNNAPFLGFAAGEVVYLGGRGSDGTTSEATINHGFATERSLTAHSIGDVANVVKEGWNAAWISYQADVDANRLVKSPEFVYIERVYDTVNLAAALGFG